MHADELPIRVCVGADFDRIWRQAPSALRAHVEEVVENGEAMEDPALAALAAGLAISRRKAVRQQRLIGTGILVLLLATLPSVDDLEWTRLIIVPLFAWQVIQAWRVGDRYDRAEAANRAVLRAYWDETAPPPPSQGTVKDALKRWGRIVRRERT